MLEPQEVIRSNTLGTFRYALCILLYLALLLPLCRPEELAILPRFLAQIPKQRVLPPKKCLRESAAVLLKMMDLRWACQIPRPVTGSQSRFRDLEYEYELTFPSESTSSLS